MAVAGNAFCPTIVGLNALRTRIARLGKAPTEPLRRRLVNSWEGAADSFISAAVRRILVDTGMSAASFFPLSRAINRVRGTRTIESSIARGGGGLGVVHPGIPTFPSGARRPGFQGVIAGEQLGKKAFVFQTPEAGARFFVFRFSFQTVVFQLSIHQANEEALAAGTAAFVARVRKDFIEDTRLVVRAYLRGRVIPSQGII